MNLQQQRDYRSTFEALDVDSKGLVKHNDILLCLFDAGISASDAHEMLMQEKQCNSNPN